MKSSTNMAWNLGSRMSGVELSQTPLKREISSLEKDASEIKSMMTEMYAAFQGHPSSAPSGGVTLTLVLTDIQANVEGENVNTTAIEEPPSHTEGETEEPKLAIPISSIPSTAIPPTQAQPITSIIIHPERSQATPNIDKGKGIATESDDDPSKKLVKASSIVCPDPDEPVRVEFMINGKIVYLNEQEIQDYWDKEEQIKKAKEEAMLLAITKPEDAEHAVLKRQHTERVRKSLELKKPKYDSYMWTVSGRLKPEPITNIKIHPKTKPVIITVYKGNNGRNFKRYERLKEISKELGIQSALPASIPEQASSQTSGRNRKHMELEPEVKVPGLECNRSLLKGVPFVNNMKVGMDSLVSYLEMASMVKTEENARFSLKLRKLITNYLDQEKLKSKKVKLEALRYHVE
ncbi:hypothetical protein Tco_1368833 [Tanacetum coccineum]